MQDAFAKYQHSCHVIPAKMSCKNEKYIR